MSQFHFHPRKLEYLAKKLERELGKLEVEEGYSADFNLEETLNELLSGVPIRRSKRIAVYYHLSDVEIDERYSTEKVLEMLREGFHCRELRSLCEAVCQLPNCEPLLRFLKELDEPNRINTSSYRFLKNYASQRIRGGNGFKAYSDEVKNEQSFDQALGMLGLRDTQEISHLIFLFFLKNLSDIGFNWLCKNEFLKLESLPFDLTIEAIEILVRRMVRKTIAYSDRPDSLHKRIVASLGPVPEAESEHARSGRWANLAKDVFEDILQWNIILNIHEFFSGDGDFHRINFWKTIAEQGVVSGIQVWKDIGAFKFIIGQTVYIEFGQVGNALYIYSRDEFDSKFKRKPTYVRHLKHKGIAARTIAHRGSFEGKWQTTTIQDIEMRIGRKLQRNWQK